MSIAKQTLLTEIDYTVWANRRLLDASATITVEEVERDLGASHRSIAGTMRHIFDAEYSWLHRLGGMTLPPLTAINSKALSQNPQAPPGLNALVRQFPAVWTG